MDALENVAVWEKLFALTSPRPGGIEGRDGPPPPVPRSERAQVMAAIAGIDIALWDIKGKAAGLPVYRLLGGENRPIFTYATGGYYRPNATNADYGQELARFLELGYQDDTPGSALLVCGPHRLRSRHRDHVGLDGGDPSHWAVSCKEPKLHATAELIV